MGPNQAFHSFFLKINHVGGGEGVRKVTPEMEKRIFALMGPKNYAEAALNLFGFPNGLSQHLTPLLTERVFAQLNAGINRPVTLVKLA